MSKASQEISGQFQGLSSTVYVNSHLLKAIQLASKLLPSERLFSPQWLKDCRIDKEALDFIERGIEFQGVVGQTRDGRRQTVDQSKLYDLEKYGKVSSDLKRRSLTKKGSKRFLDALLCFWFYANDDVLPFKNKISKDGSSYLELEMENSSSPKSYSIAYKTPDGIEVIVLRGSGQVRRSNKRRTGKTSSKTVAAETVKSDSSQGSKPVSAFEQLQRAAQINSNMVSANPSSSGPSYPGE